MGMKITLTNTAYQDFAGEELTDEFGKPLTLKHIIIRALLTQQQNDPSTGEEKYHRYKLAENISSAANEIELTTEDAALIKKLIGKLFVPIIVGRAYDDIEGKTICKLKED